MDCKKINEPVILIVDDNLNNLKLLSDMLGRNGYKTRRAISGNLALQALNAINFDLILLDITMPDMDGYQVCQKIKENSKFQSIPIIFISALNDVADKVKAFDAGGVDYITKPFQIEEITARVANQLRIVALQTELTKLNQQLDEKNEKLERQQESLTKSQARIVHNSLKDPVTNLNTKIAFTGQLRQLINRCQENNNYDYLLIKVQYEQLNNYKYILTPEAENKYFTNIAKKIEQLLERDSFAGWLDNNTFGILLQNISNQAAAVSQLRIIKESLQINLQTNHYNLGIAPNYGIVTGAKSYKTPEQLLYNAQIALNESLLEGYGTHKVFKVENRTKIIHQLRLQTLFKQALNQQNIDICYQPIISLSHNKISGLNATVDWQFDFLQDNFSKERNVKVDREQIIEIAADTGSLPQLNRLVLTSVCDRLRQYQEMLMWQQDIEANFLSDFAIYLKLHKRQFLQPNFPQQLREIIEQQNIEKEGFSIVVSADIFRDDLQLAIANLVALQQLDISIGIDRLNKDLIAIMLQHDLSISHLAIDPCLLDNYKNKEVEPLINKQIVYVANCLNMTVTAINIDDKEKLEQIKQQGFAFATGIYVEQLASSKVQVLHGLGV